MSEEVFVLTQAMTLARGLRDHLNVLNYYDDAKPFVYISKLKLANE